MIVPNVCLEVECDTQKLAKELSEMVFDTSTDTVTISIPGENKYGTVGECLAVASYRVGELLTDNPTSVIDGNNDITIAAANAIAEEAVRLITSSEEYEGKCDISRVHVGKDTGQLMDMPDQKADMMFERARSERTVTGYETHRH